MAHWWLSIETIVIVIEVTAVIATSTTGGAIQ